jgi:hypothetical protein
MPAGVAEPVLLLAACLASLSGSFSTDQNIQKNIQDTDSQLPQWEDTILGVGVSEPARVAAVLRELRLGSG